MTLVAALGVDAGISKSEVSRICSVPDESVTAFRPGYCTTTSVFLDATYLHVRRTRQATSIASRGERGDRHRRPRDPWLGWAPRSAGPLVGHQVRRKPVACGV